MHHYVLLDRDGVINRKISCGYVTSWHQFEFLPGAMEALCRLRENGCRTLVISNQAAVGKKLMTMEQLSDLTRRFLQHAHENGGQIHGVYYCPHAMEDDCDCRKPRPGLLFKAQKEHRFSFAETFLVGDSDADGLAALSAGCPFIRLVNGESERIGSNICMPRAIFPSLLQAVNYLLALREVKHRGAELAIR